MWALLPAGDGKSRKYPAPLRAAGVRVPTGTAARASPFTFCIHPSFSTFLF